MLDQRVVDAVRRYLGALEDLAVHASFAVVYGSHAVGTPTEESDIDVIVVAEFFDEHRDYDANLRLWRAKVGQDWRIEPVPCGLREWEEDDTRAIVEIARREGVRVKLSGQRAA